MANCENCGITFTPSAQPTEVTSLRVLCPKCEAERRAEKQRRAAAGAQSASTQGGGARAGAPPVPAARPGPAMHGAGASVPARATPASPGPAASRPAAPQQAAAGRATAAAHATRPAPSPAKTVDRPHHPAAGTSHKPIPGAKPHGKGEPVHPDVQRELEILKQRESKIMTIAWIVCGVMLLTAGGAWAYAQNKKQAEKDRIAAREAVVADFMKQLEGFSLQDETQARQAIEFAEARVAIWQDELVSGEVTSIVSRAKNSIDTMADRREQTERLANVEAAARDASSKSIDELTKIRRTLDSLEQKSDALGTEFKTRVDTVRIVLDRVWVTRLHAEATAQAGKGSGNERVAMAAFTKAEDEATKMLDKVIRTNNREAVEFFRGHFQQIITESDTHATAYFTSDVIEKTPWINLLDESQRKNWQQDGLSGFQLANGQLHVVGPSAGTTKNGIIAIPAAGGYRDFVMEMEFTIVKGRADLLFRLGRRVDNTVEYYTVNTAGSDALKTGQSYVVMASFIGSKLTVVLTPADVPEFMIESGWTKSRKGAFGAQVPEGAEIKFTRLRIRQLRDA